MHEYLKGYNVLSSCRSIGFGLNPISMSDIMAYLALFPTYDIEAFVMVVKELDHYELSKKEERNGEQEVDARDRGRSK